MPNHFVLDTHAFVWFLDNDPALSDRAAAVFDEADASLYFPAICMLEAFDMVRKRRTMLTIADLVQAIRNEARMSVLPLDQAGAMIGGTLDELSGIHDRAIVAATMQLTAEMPSGDVWLVTKDQEIHEGGRVKVLW